VRDEQDGEAELAVEVAQQLEDRAGGLRVQGAGGLVGEQHLGVAGQRPGDADSLLLTAGELGGVAAGLVGEADQVVFMDEGEVVEAGTPAELFDNPRSERLQRFLSEVL
jgi:hypothetical protein